MYTWIRSPVVLNTEDNDPAAQNLEKTSYAQLGIREGDLGMNPSGVIAFSSNSKLWDRNPEP